MTPRNTNTSGVLEAMMARKDADAIHAARVKVGTLEAFIRLANNGQS